MTIRAFGALFCGAAFLLVTQTGAFAAEDKKKKADPASTRATTVKSSKSNTSDRMDGGGGGKGSYRATTVKRSNTSDRTRRCHRANSSRWTPLLVEPPNLTSWTANRSGAASCVDGPQPARVFFREEHWSLAVMCPAFRCGLT